MQKDDSIPSAGADADSEQKAEVTTSSSNNTKPHVVGSQCTPMSYGNYTIRNRSEGETTIAMDKTLWELVQ